MDAETLKLWAAIIASVVVKFLLTDDELEERPTRARIWQRRRRAIGGILAGILIAYFGYEPVIRWVPVFTPEDKIVVAIGLGFTGEHITRWLIGIGPDFITRLAARLLGGQS